jgi:hypothetical protein
MEAAVHIDYLAGGIIEQAVGDGADYVGYVFRFSHAPLG